ncbi:hypothetical protein [Hydrogenovibrio sp. JE_KL2]|uniref:hypothetical protein n=1 Tax=Hydrogenovibrio sp. JE_KL2 TaxID=2651188 RepID=UPI00128C9CAD|nr:hypothetical protein [Hydrogenovibrio sp. JE_KL2]MPQ76654.1 keratin [Hydrogenovibrio sp. JE_KL2]
MSGMFSGFFGLIFFVFLLVAGILWFLMPFAVFGTKSKLEELIQAQAQTNQLLSNMHNEIAELRKSLSKE